MSDEELRYAEDDKGRVYLDEIVSHGGDLHFEMLGDQSAMLRFGVGGKYALNGKPTPHFWRAK